MYGRLRIDANHLAKQLAEALNDVGFGSKEDAPWLIDEFFGRIERNFHGSSVSLEEAVKTAQDLLEYQEGSE